MGIWSSLYTQGFRAGGVFVSMACWMEYVVGSDWWLRCT